MFMLVSSQSAANKDCIDGLGFREKIIVWSMHLDIPTIRKNTSQKLRISKPKIFPQLYSV